MSISKVLTFFINFFRRLSEKKLFSRTFAFSIAPLTRLAQMLFWAKTSFALQSRYLRCKKREQDMPKRWMRLQRLGMKAITDSRPLSREGTPLRGTVEGCPLTGTRSHSQGTSLWWSQSMTMQMKFMIKTREKVVAWVSWGREAARKCRLSTKKWIQ